MASHVTKLFFEIFEPTINIFLEAGEEMLEMTVVKLGTGPAEGSVFLATGDGDPYPYGWCTQNVTTTGTSQYGLNGLMTRGAKIGDKIGVYVGGGILKTDKLVDDDIVAGDLLYPSPSGDFDGYVSKIPSEDAIPVGLCELGPDGDNIIRFKSLI